MKNLLRVLVYILLSAFFFSVSGKISTEFFAYFSSSTSFVPLLPGWAFAGAMLNFCLRGRTEAAPITILGFWLVALSPVLATWLVKEAYLTIAPSFIYSDTGILLTQLAAFIASFLSVNHLMYR